MDSIIARYKWRPDADLRICGRDGVAYQADMAAGRVPYDADYLAKCDAYEGSGIARAVNAGRCALLGRHLPAGASVLDIGAGSGAFVRAAAWHGYRSAGFDVIPDAAERLHQQGRYADCVEQFAAVTLWDVLEHIEDPAPLLDRIGLYLFVSLPIYVDLGAVRASRHYRPGEHLYYWTAAGLIAWLRQYGFRLLEQSDHEIRAGRDSIGAFAFIRTTEARYLKDET